MRHDALSITLSIRIEVFVLIILQVNGLTKTFSGEPIIENAQLSIREGDRVALVGRNGAGKSTFLKIIAGELNKDAGQIIMPKDLTIGYLEQHAHLHSERAIWDEMMTVFEPLIALEQEIRALEQQMSTLHPETDKTTYDEVMKKYDYLQNEYTTKGGYVYEAETRAVLNGMQFFEEDYTKRVSTLSGGQKTRLALAKLLLTRPNLLILDEPTNHLDIQTLEWLEGYLSAYRGSILIVSHDRFFLDKIVNVTYEISRRHVTKYNGNYSYYVTEKAKNYEIERRRFEKEQTEKAKLEEYIARNIARAATSKMAKSRRKKLERTNWMDAPDGDERSARFSFTTDQPSGQDVLQCTNLSIGYEQPVASQLNGRAYRGDRIAIVGPNGVGKSTLLKTIIRRIPPLAGEIFYGTNVTFGYYDQEQATLLGNGTVLSEIWDDWPMMNEGDIRSLLGSFLFSGDDVEKPVSALSGGERARLSLAKLMLEKANTLILDEPTNHLDLDSKEVLENALEDFDGTLLFVSHDRYFMNRIATKVIELTEDGLVEYLGNYNYYLEKKQEMLELQQLEEEETTVEVNEKPSIALSKERKRERRKITRKIERLEKELATLDDTIERLMEEMSSPELANDHVALMDLQKQVDEASEEKDLCEVEWLETQETLEQFDREQ